MSKVQCHWQWHTGALCKLCKWIVCFPHTTCTSCTPLWPSWRDPYPYGCYGSWMVLLPLWEVQGQSTMLSREELLEKPGVSWGALSIHRSSFSQSISGKNLLLCSLRFTHFLPAHNVTSSTCNTNMQHDGMKDWSLNFQLQRECFLF